MKIQKKNIEGNRNGGNFISIVYDNEYTSIIDIYFYETFSTLNPLRSKTFLDTLSDVLDKCLRFSLIKIESILINPSQATLGLFSSVVYTFLLKCYH